MKVIVSVDDSESSTRAVEAVRNRSWPAGTKFLVVAVVNRYQVPAPPSSMLRLLGTGFRGPRDRATHARVTVQLAVEELRASNLEAQGEVRMGNSRREILRAAQESAADLIVIGSPWAPGWPRALRGAWGGGLATRVSASAPCSVDVIRGTGASAVA